MHHGVGHMCHGCGLAGRNTRNTFVTAGPTPAVSRSGSLRLSVRYSDEYYFLLGGHALTSPKGGGPCSLGTLHYGVVGHLAFRLT